MLGFDLILYIHCVDPEMYLSQVKGLSKEELAMRNDLVVALPERIQSIPDGSATGTKQTSSWTASASRTEIKFDSTSGS